MWWHLFFQNKQLKDFLKKLQTAKKHKTYNSLSILNSAKLGGQTTDHFSMFQQKSVTFATLSNSK